MFIFTWNPAWDTGNATIDRQHMQLFEQLEKLVVSLAHGTEVGETERTLLLLGDYIEIHFKNEESIMAQAGYPDLVAHRAIHDDLRDKVKILVETYQDNPKAIPSSVLQFLLNWLKEHLGGADQLMAAHLRQN